MTPGVVPNIAVDYATSQALPPAPPSCSWLGTTWDFYFNPDAWKQCQLLAAQAQIQSVPQNAAAKYGPNSPTAIVAQQAADQQMAQAAGDIENAAQVYGAGSLIATPNPEGATMPTWALAALLIGGIWLVKNLS